MLVSYAQNFEDVILWRALKHVANGFYIDIGAQDPVADSVSLAFYEHGWRGVHIEPTPSNAAKLRAARPDEDVVEAAIARTEGTITLFEIADTGLSTGRDDIATAHAESGFAANKIDVAALPLSKLFERYAERQVHWLKIDVEGMEGDVIASWQDSPVRPWILVVESTWPRSQEPDHSGWEQNVLALGYEFVYFDGLNRFYVHQDHAELRSAFGVGPNFFDDFSVGGSAPYARQLNSEIAAKVAQLSEREAEIARLHSHINETDKAHATERGSLIERAAMLEKLGHDKDAEIARLHSHINETDKAHATERGSLIERAAMLEKLGHDKDAEIGRLHSHINETDKAHAAERGSLVERAAMLEKLGHEKDAEIGRLHAHIQATARESHRIVSSLEALIAERNSDLANRAAALSQADAQLADLRQQLGAIYTSTSWQITAPLRGGKISAGAIVRWPGSRVRLFMEHTLFWLRRRPRALVLAKRSLRIAPLLERQLRTFSRARPAKVVHADTRWALEPEREVLDEWCRLLQVPRAT